MTKTPYKRPNPGPKPALPLGPEVSAAQKCRNLIRYAAWQIRQLASPIGPGYLCARHAREAEAHKAAIVKYRQMLRVALAIGA